MEFEGYKSVWLDREERALDRSSAPVTSQALRRLRLSTARDLEQARDKSQVIFCFLFALAVAGAAFAVLPQGTSPIVALFLAAALLIQGVIGMILIFRKHRDTDRSMRDYITGEHLQAMTRFRLERFSQVSLLVLTAAAVVAVLIGPRLEASPAREMDSVTSMFIVTALLVMAWIRARSVAWNRRVSRELEGYMRDLESWK